MLTTPPEEPRLPDGVQLPHPSDPVLVRWEALPGDRWSALAGMAGTDLVIVEIAQGAGVDPLALLAAGARAVVAAGCPPAELAMAHAAVLAGGSLLTPTVLARRGAGSRRAEDALGPRELETLRHLAEGLTHRQVARRLGVTEQTVSTYAKRLRRKLGASNVAELTRRAVELGYVAEST